MFTRSEWNYLYTSVISSSYREENQEYLRLSSLHWKQTIGSWSSNLLSYNNVKQITILLTSTRLHDCNNCSTKEREQKLNWNVHLWKGAFQGQAQAEICADHFLRIATLSHLNYYHHITPVRYLKHWNVIYESRKNYFYHIFIT